MDPALLSRTGAAAWPRAISRQSFLTPPLQLDLYQPVKADESEPELRYLARRLSESLRDVKRVAESRGARLPS
ncbi:hypothetical protein ACFXDH_39135 [Streptomyces sp. NPDC059467]|uniref:hypothetical protein n=1 Tax=Streptomyces sp. NPDC059467 TaxID=3346844 RepID=UPI00367551EB